jgi:DNA-binding MarR family transcriptional regulator
VATLDQQIHYASQKVSKKLSEKLFRRKYDVLVARDVVDEIADAWGRELPGVVGTELELSKRAARLAALLTVPVEAALARLGLTKAEYDILAVLRAAGTPYRLRPSVLTQRLVLTSGGTSNVLRRLAAADLIERDPDPFDARISWVRLSKHGVKVAEEVVRAASTAQAAALRDVPPGTTRAAIDALRDVLIALGDTAT